MKLIDADKLRAEIERRITDNTFGAKLELIDILAWLDTLSEEPDKSLEEAAEKRAIEYAERETPKDADGEIWKVGDVMIENRMSFEDGFIVGANWQKEQKPKNELPDYDININDLEEFPEELLKHYNELLIDAGEIGRKVGEIVSASLKKHYILGLQAGKKESNEQKEQKPWKVGANAYFTPEQKPAEWVLPEDFEDAVYKVANFISPFDSQEELRKVSHRFAEQLLSLAKKELDKPAEWDEYTKMNLDRALQIIKEAKGTLQGYQTDDGIYECDKAIEALEHFLYRGLEIEKSAEWSEEDEKMSMSILNLLCSQVAYLTNNGKTTGKLFPTYANERDWFKKRIKSLRPQSQYRDTYYDIIHSILVMLKDIDFMQITPEHRVSLLNDIRVRCKHADEWADILDEPQWKPSEEQMEALRRASTNEYLSAKQFDILVSLREQLEKLM